MLSCPSPVSLDRRKLRASRGCRASPAPPRMLPPHRHIAEKYLISLWDCRLQSAAVFGVFPFFCFSMFCFDSAHLFVQCGHMQSKLASDLVLLPGQRGWLESEGVCVPGLRGTLHHSVLLLTTSTSQHETGSEKAN